MSSTWTGLSLVTRGIMYYCFCDHKISRIVLALRSFHQLSLNSVFFLSWLLYLPLTHFCNTYPQAVFVTAHATRAYAFLRAVQRHSLPFQAAVGCYRNRAAPPGFSVGFTQAFQRFFLGAKVFLAICKAAALSILILHLKVPGHSPTCLLPTCTQWLPRA